MLDDGIITDEENKLLEKSGIEIYKDVVTFAHKDNVLSPGKHALLIKLQELLELPKINEKRTF